MSNKHKNSTFSPRLSGSKKPQKIIVYVEGQNTEKSYIDLLKKSNLKVVPVVKFGKGIGSCEGFVRDCMRAFDTIPNVTRKGYTQRWLMFDYDGHSDFDSAIRLARDNGFYVAFSSMCIEYWFLLHFMNHDGLPIPCRNGSHSYAQIKRINDHIKKYNKSIPKNQPKVKLYDEQSKNIEKDLFEHMLAVDPVSHRRRVEDACMRSYEIHQAKCANGAEFTESVTTMHQFLEK